MSIYPHRPAGSPPTQRRDPKGPATPTAGRSVRPALWIARNQPPPVTGADAYRTRELSLNMLPAGVSPAGAWAFIFLVGLGVLDCLHAPGASG
jgi:hypothetical protein